MKTLIIGLDAATMDLVGPWAEAGHLPALARLVREGTSGHLLSTPNMHSASAWTSILTGLNPGRHGLFVFSDRDFASGRQVFFKGGDRAGETLGAHLARHGHTSGFLNVPMTYPADSAPGSFIVSGLDAPALNGDAFCPRELREELLARFPDYAFTPPGLGDLMRAGRIDDAISVWLKLTETQTAAAEYLIKSHPTDLFMIVFTASDWGGHNLWNDKDGLLLKIYRALDRAVSRLVACAGSDTNIFVISDHGMGPHSGASYHLAGWLESSGYMARRPFAQRRGSVVSAGRRAAASLLPVGIKEKIKTRLGAERVKQLHQAEKDTFYASIDWSRSVAYTEPGRHVININLAGRNLNGIVAPKDYAAVCDKIIGDLSGWKDERGVELVERVAHRDELYSGPFVERASDLYVYWNAAARIAEPPEEVRARGFWWSGDHRPEGILLAKGPGIRSGSQFEDATVYDLVPTILHATRLGVPGGLDGKVIETLFTEEHAGRNPVRLDAPSAEAGSRHKSLTEAEEEMVEEKLKSLGYL
jgi:predicted AlkP superfamily phosphohydrolase/phosphomutase